MSWGRDSWDEHSVSAGAPLFTALAAFADRARTSFHMPAGAGQLPDFTALDVTELAETDDLNNPQGPALAAQQAAALFFGAAQSRLLTEGSSQGVFVALLALAGYGGKVILPRSVHRSFMYAAQRFSLDLHFVLPLEARKRQHFSQAARFPLIAPDLADYERVLNSEKDVKVVVATAPDYYGCIPDLPGLEALCRKYHCLLLIDAAHGAHLHAWKAWRLYGDVVVESAHKTLPALTPGAFLHICPRPEAERLAERVDVALQILRTSSPPLFLAAACDWARSFLERYGAEAATAQHAYLQKLRAQLPEGLRMLNPSPVPLAAASVFEGDPLRLVLDASHYMSGHELMQRLAEREIYAEFADLRRVVMIPSLLFGEEEYARLAAALESIVQVRLPLPSEAREQLLHEDRGFYARLSGLGGCAPELSGKALHASLQRRLEGRAEAEDLAEIPYPPGIPLRWPTEAYSLRGQSK